MATSIFTIGYEAKTLSGLSNLLKKAAVEVVVDVRFLPLSRKPGFSKRAFAGFLTRRGFEYISLRNLGTPPDIRRQYKLDNNFEVLISRYQEYLFNNKESLKELYSLASTRRCCLLCYESSANLCHRSVLASVLSQVNGHKFHIHHL
jgi:uncharacterized protein (DUF488 family)